MGGASGWLTVMGSGSFSRMALNTLSCDLPFEGAASGDHLVENAAEAEEVAACVGFRALQKFGGHVLKGSDDGALLGERGHGCGKRSQIHGRRGRRKSADRLRRNRHLRFGQAKSPSTCATFSQHDVRRLQIAMDDALLMRLLQGLSDFGSNLQDLIERQRAFSQALGEGLAFEILHDQGSRLPSCVPMS